MKRTPGRADATLPKLLWPLMLATVSGCAIQAHDAELDRYRLEENLKPAEVLAQKLATRDLDCPKIEAREVSAKITEGAPLGPVWRDYTIRTSGCGKTRDYTIQCEGDSNCLNH